MKLSAYSAPPIVSGALVSACGGERGSGSSRQCPSLGVVCGLKLSNERSTGKFSAKSGKARSSHVSDAGAGRVRNLIWIRSAARANDEANEGKGIRHYPSGGRGVRQRRYGTCVGSTVG